MNYHRIGENGSKVGGKRSAGILFTDGKSILLLKRAGNCRHSGTWAFPGGHGREGETPINTAIREAREETGLKSIPGYRFDSMTSQDGHKHFTTFLYRVTDPFDCEISEEHSGWEWVPFDELSKTNLHPKVGENIERYLKAIRRKTRSFVEWAYLTRLLSEKSCNL